MQATRKVQIAELKHILEHVQSPAALDEHPWTRSLTVRAYAEAHPDQKARRPGYLLLAALSDLFRASMPAHPPRQGKRLDNRWGEFGLLAALYFAPFDYGAVRPATLADGWGRIDDEILRYVFGRGRDELSSRDVEAYRLVGNELQAAPVSTLSDWHMRGLERLLANLREREQLLSARYGLPSVVLNPDAILEMPSLDNPPPTAWARLGEAYRQGRRRIWIGIGLLLVLLFAWQGIGFYNSYRALKADVDRLQALATDPSLESVAQAGEMIAQARRDALLLQRRLHPWRWAARLLGWVPVYGGDLASAEDLVAMAAALTVAGDEAYQAVVPLLPRLDAQEGALSRAEIVRQLSIEQPRLATAAQAADRALAARQAIELEGLSPKTRPLVEKLDPYLPLLADGLDVLQALPAVVGASEDGPQTYLVLIQNEDELRATGGFITAVAVVTVEGGEIISLQVDDSYAIDDLSKLYPQPPWQIMEYLVGGVWLLRDANWSPDFPTTAEWAEYLYAIGRLHAVDGVIAVDQQLLRLLLEAIGPVEIPDWPQPISAENFIVYVRASRGKSEGEEDWFEARKDFMGPLGFAILEKLQNAPDVSWQAVGKAILQALEERHLLLSLDQPSIRQVLARRGWDGAMRPGEGDFLMVVDSNLGFNKANAAVEESLQYVVDLSDLRSPRAELTVVHRNPTEGDEPCRHAAYDSGDYQALIARCYWDYLRVYTLAGAELLEATPHEVPAEWLLSGEGVPARVDVLDNQGLLDENPPGLQAYGTMLVVPLGESRQTRFVFALPEEVLLQGGDGQSLTYALRVKKQPGTLANPLTLTIQLPAGARLIAVDPAGELQDGVWRMETHLRTDVDIRLTFSIP